MTQPALETPPFGLELGAGKQLMLAFAVMIVLSIASLALPFPYGLLIPIGLGLSLVIIRSAGASLLTYALLDIILSVRSKGPASGGTGAIDIVCGFLFLGISAYWLFKIRFMEWRPLSQALPTLGLVVFYCWSLLITCCSVWLPNHDISDALHELLNLLPVITLPIIYEIGIKEGSWDEKAILALMVVGGIFLVGWNIHVLRSHAAAAFYLFQIGRASSNPGLSIFLVLLGASALMTLKKNWAAKLAGAIVLIGFVGIVISLSRALYIAIFVGLAVTIYLGNPRERRSGALQLLKAAAVGVAALLLIAAKFRTIALLASSYVLRLASARHLGTDLSLLQRYIEWGYLWEVIKSSPIIGFGFGAHFLVYNIITREHDWMSFSHSSYLYLIFKTGFFGATLFFASYLGFLKLGWRLSRERVLDPFRRAIARTGCAFMVAMLLNYYAAPDLDSKTDLIWMGLIWGFFLATDRKLKRQLPAAEAVAP